VGVISHISHPASLEAGYGREGVQLSPKSFKNAHCIMRLPAAVSLLRYGPQALLELIHAQVHEFTLPKRSLAALGSGSYLHKRASLRSPENISIGRDVSIGPESRLWASPGAKLFIGDKALLGPNVLIVTSNHGAAERDVAMVDQPWIERDVHIGADVWIGANAVVLPGITVGEHSIIAAGAIVTGDVAPYSVVGGVPAAVIRSR
jgi:acetyltransferase-like isoleucine patch superfamily enzyme